MWCKLKYPTPQDANCLVEIKEGVKEYLSTSQFHCMGMNSSFWVSPTLLSPILSCAIHTALI